MKGLMKTEDVGGIFKILAYHNIDDNLSDS